MNHTGIISGIVLAAGESKRAGRFKLTLPLGDKCIIEHAVGGMYGVCDEIIVVTGFRADDIVATLRGYKKVIFAHNDNYKEGMFTSVKVGVANLSKRCERFFVLPGDCPFISEKTYIKLLEADGEIVVPTYRGRNGHPVLLRGELAEKILQKPDSHSLRYFIEEFGFVKIPVDERSILLDIDNLEDYKRAKRLKWVK